MRGGHALRILHVGVGVGKQFVERLLLGLVGARGGDTDIEHRLIADEIFERERDTAGGGAALGGLARTQQTDLDVEVGHAALVTGQAMAFLQSYYGTGNQAGLDDAMGTLSTRDRHALVAGAEPRVEDLYFRMLKAHEVKAGMAFDREYVKRIDADNTLHTIDKRSMLNAIREDINRFKEEKQVDRVVMLLTNQASIRDVLLFPHMKPEKGFQSGAAAAKAAEATAFAAFERLRQRFGDRVCLLHGKLSDTEKRTVVDRMNTGAASLLVSTVVIEVGITLPSLRLLVVVDPDRLGLASLHQLRGWTAELRGGLQALGLAPQPSVTPFLCALRPSVATPEWLRARGLAVRCTASFGLAGHMRVSAQPPEATAALLQAMADAQRPSPNDPPPEETTP